MMLASIAEREQFRSLSAAKVRKIFQKTAFWEEINTISVQNMFNLYRKRYIVDGNSPRKQLNSIKMMNRKRHLEIHGFWMSNVMNVIKDFGLEREIMFKNSILYIIYNILFLASFSVPDA
jgi:hypothetical protein